MRKFARHVLASEGIAPQCELSILLCNQKTISQLNQVHLGRAGPTDVLAFPQDAPPTQPSASDEVAIIGDVAICTDLALQQAQQSGVTLQQETLFLLAHGILHLLRYRDDTPSARRKMMNRQEQLLENFPEGTRDC